MLDRVSMAAADGGPPPIVVFGLDGCLFDCRVRTLQVLREYGESVRETQPEITERLSTLARDDIELLLSDTLRRCGLARADIVRDATSFWRERFHHDDYLDLDEPGVGALEYVRAIQDAGGGIVYLAGGRDVPGMLMGTVQRLRDEGFPIAEPAIELVLKPDATLGDESFARLVFKRLAQRGDIVGVLDADPGVCEHAHDAFPEADVVLLDVWELEPPENVHVVKDFRLR